MCTDDTVLRHAVFRDVEPTSKIANSRRVMKSSDLEFRDVLCAYTLRVFVEDFSVDYQLQGRIYHTCA